jgi:hypothetical protein
VVTRKTKRLTRDSIILIVAILWGTFEIAIGGARPGVLTLVGSMLLSPAVMRIDEAIRERKRDNVG